jgi:cyclopropane fatty-acyl-phospholipid synthase-like methyltransferase
MRSHPVKASVPERVRRAVDVLHVQPNDRLLEIGPGPGVAAALIGERLEEGCLVAIDRSAVAVRRTLNRNGALVAAGKVEVRHSSLEDFDGSGGPFDKVFAIDVNLFWVRDATAELARIADLLAPGGTLYLFFETPSPTKGREVVDRVRRNLRRSGFDASIEQLEAVSATVARPKVGASAQPGDEPGRPPAARSSRHGPRAGG